MSNPKIYIKINKAKNVIIPVNGLNGKKLDKLFSNIEVINDNVNNYNDYTKNFISENDDHVMYWSTDYSWNPKLFTFNFNSIVECTNDDYVNMVVDNGEFDANKEYKFSGATKTTSKKSYIDDIISENPCPDISTGFYIEERKWKILLRNILRHQNTMLVGPTGTGKTDIIIRICKALDIPCRVYDMGAMMDPLTDLLGSHRLENGSSKFDYSKFVRDIQEPGVILLDELSRAPVMTNNILFPCLDTRRVLPVEIADSNGPREIPVHPECTFIATANIGSEYSGTNELDTALENRFMSIQVDYLPKTIEEQILTIRTGCSSAIASKIVNVANTLREHYLRGTISKTISTRETILCGELINDGFSIIEGISFAFCEKFLKYGDNSEYDTIKKIVMGF